MTLHKKNYAMFLFAKTDFTNVYIEHKNASRPTRQKTNETAVEAKVT